MLAHMLRGGPIHAQQRVPVRALGPVSAVTSAGVLSSVTAVLPFRNGNVLVHDIVRRQVVLFGRDLSSATVVSDTSLACEVPYGQGIGGLIPWGADSALLIDPRSLTMVVLDSQGRSARVMAVPSPRDAYAMIGGPFGTPAFDREGRLIFRGLASSRSEEQELALDSSRTAAFVDSAPVLRVDLRTRQRDTLTRVAIPRQRVTMHANRDGRYNAASLLSNPLTPVDDWVLLSDGKLAVVRGRDYHVEILDPTGAWKVLPRVPFPWERLDDESKQFVLDSVRREATRARALLQEQVARDARVAAAANWAGLGVAAISHISYPSGRSGPPKVDWIVPQPQYVAAGRLPDYRPAFRLGALRSDPDGNLWVRTTARSAGGTIYDVVDADGRLVDRVQVPFGRIIAGFGREGTVFLGVLDQDGARMERASIR
jgi:hypothetical protein